MPPKDVCMFLARERSELVWVKSEQLSSKQKAHSTHFLTGTLCSKWNGDSKKRDRAGWRRFAEIIITCKSKTINQSWTITSLTL